MENLFQSVVALQEQLCQAGILSAVIGGVVVGVWGEPRVTRDVDIKVLLGRDAAPRLLLVGFGQPQRPRHGPRRTIVRRMSGAGSQDMALVSLGG